MDTDKKMTFCSCKAIAVDGCKYYTRIVGDQNDWKAIHIEKR